MKYVYFLRHEYYFQGDFEFKNIGIYSSEANALAASEPLKQLPGFNKFPEGFVIKKIELNHHHEPHGFESSSVLAVPVLESELPRWKRMKAKRLHRAIRLKDDDFLILPDQDDTRLAFKSNQIVKCKLQEAGGYHHCLVPIKLVEDLNLEPAKII